MGLPLISSPMVDLIKWSGLSFLFALLALSVWLSAPGAFYWKFLLFVALAVASLVLGVRAFLRPPICLTCKRPLAPKARVCPHCGRQEV